MGITWKLTSLVAVFIAIAALVFAIHVDRRSDEQIRLEVQRQIAQREKELVLRCKNSIDVMRADAGLPRKDMESMDDILDGFLSIFNGLADSIGKSAAPRK